MDVLDTAAWESRAAALADELGSAGVLADLAWRDAFASMPRHLFVPRILAGSTTLAAGDPGWLDAVYADESLATQTRSAGAGPARPGGRSPVRPRASPPSWR